MFSNRESRPYTALVQDLMDQGFLDPTAVADMCLLWMSEHDVKTMCRSNDILLEQHQDIYE
jgi:hypothetical protein